MGRIIISRELSFYHSMSAIKVYVDGQFVGKLYSEGNVMEYPIQADSAQVSIREWGFKTKPVRVRDGQSVLIKPRLPLILLSYLLVISCLIGWFWWHYHHPWPIAEWDSPWTFYYHALQQYLFTQVIYLNFIFPLFDLIVINDLPSGYLPENE